MNYTKKVLFAIILCFMSHLSAESQAVPPAAPDIPSLTVRAAAGDVIAMVQLGRAYWYPTGTSADFEKGRVWLDRAAEKGSIDAQTLLGAAYMSGVKLSKNPQLAAKYLLQAAEQQHVESGFQSVQALAQYWVAMMYEQGSGVEKSHEKAIQFLQMAAKNGNYPAQYDLASLYNEGKGGITMDKVRACELFEKAADQGHVMAMHNAGYCYQVGVAGTQDEGKAIKYYTKAAEAGSTRSQRNLGLLFGRASQFEKAYFWLRVAESRGDTEVKSVLDKVKPAVPATEVDRAEKEIAAWLNAHPAKKQ